MKRAIDVEMTPADRPPPAANRANRRCPDCCHAGCPNALDACTDAPRRESQSGRLGPAAVPVADPVGAGKMIGAQLARDVWMAKTLADAVAHGGTAALIAGNGHVRRDVGVIRWLQDDMAKAIESHGFVEG